MCNSNLVSQVPTLGICRPPNSSSSQEFPDHIVSIREFPPHQNSLVGNIQTPQIIKLGSLDYIYSGAGNSQCARVPWQTKSQLGICRLNNSLSSQGFPDNPYSLVGNSQAPHIVKLGIPRLLIFFWWEYPDPLIVKSGIPRPYIFWTRDIPDHIYADVGKSLTNQIIQSEISGPSYCQVGMS